MFNRELIKELNIIVFGVCFDSNAGQNSIRRSLLLIRTFFRFFCCCFKIIRL